MDECRNNPCGIGAQCTNIPGGYRCSCEPGHERNPAAPEHLFGTIHSTLGSTGDQQLQLQQLQQLQQQQLAELTNTSLIACLDVNECLAGVAGKPVCGSGAQCVNTRGAYFCQCPPGFSGNPKVACVDIDECASQACGPNAQCKNLPGSYKCECKPGYSGEFIRISGHLFRLITWASLCFFWNELCSSLATFQARDLVSGLLSSLCVKRHSFVCLKQKESERIRFLSLSVCLSLNLLQKRSKLAPTWRQKGQ